MPLPDLVQVAKALVRRPLARVGVLGVGARALELAFGGRQRQAYVRTAPSAQNAVDIFAGQWFSSFPDDVDVDSGGTYPQFADERMGWGLRCLGGVDGATVLELGPMEGGHTAMIERAGARQVVAVEANIQCFLRCLVTKEVLGCRARAFCAAISSCTCRPRPSVTTSSSPRACSIT